MMEEKRSVGRSIVSAIVTGIVFGLVYIIVNVLVSFLVNFLLDVPIVGWLFDRFLGLRGDSPDMFSCIVATIAGFFVAIQVMGRVAKTNPTFSLSAKIFGIYLIAIHAISIVLNLIYGEPIFPNIMQALAGIAFVYFGKE